MKLKKIAVRGLITVAICVALCMFFSGTIQNITTPKVKVAKAARGKLTEVIELDAKLVYPKVQEVRVQPGAGQTLSITRVNARAGYAVKAGDVVVEATVTGYDGLLKQAQDEYNLALDAMMELERKNANLTLRRSEIEYSEAYSALRSATRAHARAKTSMDALLRAQNLTLSASGYPEGASEELIAAIDEYKSTEQARDTAQEEFNRASRYGVSDEAWAYITAHQSAQEKLDDCEDKLIELQELKLSVQELRAPHDGTIAQMNVKLGDAYDGATPLYTITQEGEYPALRAELKDIDKNISEGTKLRILVDGKDEDAKITAVGFTDEGVRYADVALDDALMKQLGGSNLLAASGARLSLSFKASQNTCLIPSSALRGSDKSRYVYTISTRNTSFGKQKMSIEKMDVHLIAEADGTASIEEDLSYYDIAYMEDRALREGCDVMRYVE